MSRLRLKLLGAFQLTSAEGGDIYLPTRKAKGLFAYLSFHLDQPHERAKLADLFWENSSEVQARESLRQALALLRKAIPIPAGHWLIAHGDAVAFDASNFDTDVHRFYNAARSGSTGDLRLAEELYRGEFMEGFEIRSSNSFESWLSSTRQALNEKALTCLEKLLSFHIRDHRIDQGIAVATKLLQIEPLREAVHRQLMELFRLQGRYSEALRQYEACFRILTKELGVEPESATKDMLRKIREQRNKTTDKGGEAKPSEAAPAYPSSLNVRPKEPPFVDHDRRHVTVLSLELVGLDEQLQNLGPDKLLAAAKCFFEKGCEIVSKFGGVAGSFSGNSFPAYFGYPKADEHAAECAVRAGLTLVREIAQLSDAAGLHFRARAGIAAGPLLICSFGIGKDEQVPTFIGEAPKNAALLQSLAPPDAVLITAKLRRALGTLFDYEAFAPNTALPLDNLSPWQVLREAPDADRFDALRGGTIVKFVGRKPELKRLLEDWRFAESGAGRMDLIVGEAGMGKSRLARGLQDRISGEPHLTFRYQCSPFYSNTPLHPFLHQIESAAGFRPEDGQQQKLLKLSKLLSEGSPQSSNVLQVFAALLGIAGPPASPAEAPVAAQQLRKALSTILNRMETMSRVRPLLIVVEDFQWADATSFELLNLLAERIQNLPIMAVVTSRPGLEPPWCGLDHASLIALAGLSPDEGQEIVNEIYGATPLPTALANHILDRADGIPLFIEELSKVAIESGKQQSGSSSSRNLPIPSTLQGSLLARLERQGAGKEFAQMGAVIGREFSLDLLSQIAETPGQVIEEELSKLAGAGLIYRSSSGFTFKHALVQDAAYDSLPSSRQAHLHRSLAAALIQSSGSHKPELLAHHYTGANMPAEALPFWFEAGRQAAERSANREAIGHIDRGLQLLGNALDMPEEERRGWEVRLLVLKGPCAMSLYGYGAEESRAVCERAHELIGKSTPIPAKIQILGGLWGVHFHRSEIADALAIAENLVGLSLSSGAGIEAANCMMGQTLCAAGDFVSARRYFQDVMDSYRRRRTRASGFFAVDEPVLALTSMARILWTLGYLEQSAVTINEAIEAARHSSNSASLATALLGRISMESHNVPLERAIAQAQEGIEFCADHELWLFEHWFRFNYGVLVAKQGDAGKGIEIMEAAIAAAEAKNSHHSRPLQLACLGLGYAMKKQPDKALALLDAALQLPQRTGERQSLAKIHRMRGELLLGLGRRADARQDMQEALRAARAQNAKLEELRVAMTVAKSNLALDDATDGRQALIRVYSSFTEGHSFPDLRAAQALLGRLNTSHSKSPFER
jgi:DNA-binding SARP family transcriptional activator/class 3 adenylate cyclase